MHVHTPAPSLAPSALTAPALATLALAPLALAILLMGPATWPAAAAGPNPPETATPAPVRTGKERLTDKASDEQRVNDCKVAQARRTRPRPAGCTGG